MDDVEQLNLAKSIHNFFVKNNFTLSLAESCTGGQISASITKISGASKYFLGSIVTYTNSVKNKVLHVSKESLAKYGSVSEEIAIEMALNAKKLFNSDFTLSITGVAGPDLDEKNNKPGTVFIAIVDNDNFLETNNFEFCGNRIEIINQAVNKSLEVLLNKVI